MADFSGTFEGVFVDDEDLLRTGRAWLQVTSGNGEFSVPLSDEQVAFREEIRASASQVADDRQVVEQASGEVKAALPVFKQQHTEVLDNARQVEQNATQVAQSTELVSQRTEQARVHEQAALAAAQAAKSSETKAAGSASAALSSKNAVDAKASEVASNAGIATQKAREASESATAAAASATQAGSSATTAGDKAREAQGYLGQVQMAAQDASTAASDAQGHATRSHDFAETAKGHADRAAETVSSGVPDATADVKGKLRLAGDLGGTADSPTVPGLSAKAEKVHTHAVGDVDGLQAALDGKANASHTHSQADIAGLPAALEGKANTSHTHTLADIADAPNSHTAAATASTLVSRDSSGRFQAATPTGAYHVANKGYVDTQLGVQNAVAAYSIPTAGSISDSGVYLRRVGNVVQINVRGVASSASVTLPEGWRPVLDVDFMATNVADRNKMAWVTVTKGGSVILSHTMTGTVSLWGSTSYIVDSTVGGLISGSPE